MLLSTTLDNLEYFSPLGSNASSGAEDAKGFFYDIKEIPNRSDLLAVNKRLGLQVVFAYHWNYQTRFVQSGEKEAFEGDKVRCLITDDHNRTTECLKGALGKTRQPFILRNNQPQEDWQVRNDLQEDDSSERRAEY